MDAFDRTLIQLTATMTHASRAYKSMADKVASEYSLSQATALPVLILGRLGQDGVRPGVLADALGLEPSSLVRVIDLLIDSGLIERREDPQDRRAKILNSPTTAPPAPPRWKRRCCPSGAACSPASTRPTSTPACAC